MNSNEEMLRIFGIEQDSIVDGPGLRMAVFTQGCPHGCVGCHNPHSHDPQGGYLISIREIVRKALQNPLLDGITLSGGEPMEQAGACLALLEALPAGMNAWLYTGWTWEELFQSDDLTRRRLASACQVVVDGRFVQQKRSLALPYRGSSNQRLIDVARTLTCGAVTLWSPTVWDATQVGAK